MILPGSSDQWVALDIEAGATFLTEDVLRHALQVSIEGVDRTLEHVYHLLWAMAVLNEQRERVWPHQIAQTIADGLKRVCDEKYEHLSEEEINSAYDEFRVEVERVLDQLEADFNAKAKAEAARRFIRRNV